MMALYGYGLSINSIRNILLLSKIRVHPDATQTRMNYVAMVETYTDTPSPSNIGAKWSSDKKVNGEA